MLGALGRYDEALSQLDRAVDIDPLNAEAYHNRGLIHERLGEIAAAILQYQAALFRTNLNRLQQKAGS